MSPWDLRTYSFRSPEPHANQVQCDTRSNLKQVEVETKNGSSLLVISPFLKQEEPSKERLWFPTEGEKRKSSKNDSKV